MAEPQKCASYVAVFLAFIVASGTAFANAPFGFEISVNPLSYGYCSATETKDLYKCTDAPKSDDSFDSYYLWYVRGIGVCQVVADGPMIQSDIYGFQARDAADDIARTIEREYGPATDEFDFLYAESGLVEPYYWMKTVQQKERVYAYFWSQSAGYEPIGDVAAIRVDVIGAGQYCGFIRATFELSQRRCVLRRQPIRRTLRLELASSSVECRKLGTRRHVFLRRYCKRRRAPN